MLRLFEPGLYCGNSFDKYGRRIMAFDGTVKDRYLKLSSEGQFSLVVELEGVDKIPEGWSILVYIDGEEDGLALLEKSLFRGKHVSAAGTVYLFRAATNPGEFDLKRYHSIKKHAFALYNGRVTGTVPGERIRFLQAPVTCIGEWLRGFRIFCRRILLDNLDIREAGTAGAMLLGEKGMISSETKLLYKDSGIIHILAISGLHVSLIGSGLFGILTGRKKLPGLPAFEGIGIRRAALVSAAVMILYGMMTGFGVSVFRAVLMFLVRQAARLVNRTYDMLSALSLSAILLLMAEPYCLFDTAFVFSFGAVTVIAVSAEFFKGSLSKGLFFWLFMLPLFIRSSYSFPPYSILLNLIILPLMELLIPSVMILIAAGALLPGSMAAGISSLWLRMILYFIDTLSGRAGALPYSTLITGRPSVVRMAACYTCFLLSVYLISGKKASGQGSMKRKTGAVLLTVFGLLILLVRIHTGLDICMLDVGQGDGILIRCGAGNILADGGSSSESALYEYSLYPCLSYYGVRNIDLMIISHDDYDHLSASYELLEEGRIRVKYLCLPDIPENDKGEWYRKLEAAADLRGIPVAYMAKGDVLVREASTGTQELTLTVLHPEHGRTYADANETSLTFLLSYGEFDALFTGDLESTQEESAAEAYRKYKGSPDPGGIELLKVAHHGSRDSTSEEFLDVFEPQLSLISAGRSNPYGHPHKETLDRLENTGSRVLCTAEHGAICIRAFPDGRFLVYNETYGTD